MNNRIVYTMLSKGYLPLFDIWHKQAAPYLKDFHLIVRSLDEPSYHYLKDKNISMIYNHSKTEIARDDLWILRLSDICALLKEYGWLLHSDIDAFWLTHPLDIISSCNSPIVFSREKGIPPRAVRKWGFSLCCGFFCLQQFDGIDLFLDEWQKYTSLFADDQLAVNYLAIKSEKRFVKNQNRDDIIISIKGKDISITALPFESVDRVFPATENNKITHPWFERRLFSYYIKLLHEIQNHFGKINPSTEELMIDQKTEYLLSKCDSCTKNTIIAIEWCLMRHPLDAEIIYLKGALMERCGEKEKAEKTMINAYHIAPEKLNLASLVALYPIVPKSDKDGLEKIIIKKAKQEQIDSSLIRKIVWLLIKTGHSPFQILKQKNFYKYTTNRIVRFIYRLL